MLFRFLPGLLALLALLALTADAKPWRGTLKSRQLTQEERSLTNAELLSRGLPPRSPSLGRVLSGRDATPVQKPKRPSPSPSPKPFVFSGRVAVKKKSTFIGFLKNSATGIGSVDVGGKKGTDIEVKFTFEKSPVSLLVTNPLFKGPPFVGAAPDIALAADSPNAVNITNVAETKAFAPPTVHGASAIWLFDKRTHELTAHWINPDGSAPDTTIAYDASDNFVFLTGNLTAYNAAVKAKAVDVKFFLVK